MFATGRDFCSKMWYIVDLQQWIREQIKEKGWTQGELAEGLREALRELVATPDLRAESLEVMRRKLRRAGLRVMVENGKIVKVEFGAV